MLGLLVMTSTGVADPAPGRLRLGLTVIALGLILPSSVLLILR